MQFSNNDWPQKAQVLVSLVPAKPEEFSTKKFLVAKDCPPLPLSLERDRMRRYIEEEVAMIISHCVLVTSALCKSLFKELPSPP